MRIDHTREIRKMAGGSYHASQVSEGDFSKRLRRHMEAQTTAASKETRDSRIEPEPCDRMPSAREVEVRRIPYHACDRVEVHVLEGYTLKAKLDTENGSGSGKSVYVEMKNEEGISKAWLFEECALRKESGSAAERIAYETFRHFNS